jgi:hypothetical protein
MNTNDKITSTVSFEDVTAAAYEIVDRAGRIQSMLDSLDVGDVLAYHAALQKEVDDPAFDHAFSVACAARPDLGPSALREALRGAAVTGSHGSDEGCERVTDVFVLPITGSFEEIERLLADDRALAGLERSFQDAGMVYPGGRIALSATPLRPDIIVNSTPGALRQLHHCLDRFICSERTGADRAILEHGVCEFEALCHTDGHVTSRRAFGTLMLVGFYSREYRLDALLELDAMTVQINNADADGEHCDNLEAFEELASDLTGLEIDLPHWLGRGCAAAAYETVRSQMEAEAECYGKDLSILGLDGIACARRGDVTLVEGEIDGQILGPFTFPANLADFEPDWVKERFSGMARSVMPSGRLEYGRSARLN